MTIDKQSINGHIAIITANVIFGLGIPVTKQLLDEWLTPMGYMTTRCIGAAIIFWVIALFMPKEHVTKKDMVIIMFGGLLGFVISQTLTAWSLNFTSPVYFSFIATLTPIAVMIMSALFLKEKIGGIKIFGILIGVVGALLMVFTKWTSTTGSNDIIGITLAILSLLTWALYLIITRKVTQKYSPVTQMKWVFLISTIVTLPFGIIEFSQQKLYNGFYGLQSLYGISEITFIVVFATVLGYFLIPLAMKRLSATTVSIYTNLQPLIASIVAIAVGQDIMTWDKPVAGILVLLSAYIVTVVQVKKVTT